MFLLLLACGTIYLLLGDVREALMLLGFVFVVLGITLYQERKTERALEALRDLSSPRALVIRDRERKRIAGRDVVPDDILVLAEGDRVPADSVVMSCDNLSTDESLLTGESVPVRKLAWDGVRQMSRPGGEDLPFVFSGTLVVQGQGLAQVRATGIHTEMGNIGKALQTVQLESTQLQLEVGRLVRRVAVLGLSLCVIVVVLYGLTRGDWLKGFLAGITLAMAMVPEEFPVVLTIFLALGAWRLSKLKVLARRVPVIETLGSATVLCVDKTGTLTVNRMSIRTLAVDGMSHDVGTGRPSRCPRRSTRSSSSASWRVSVTRSTRWRRRSTISAMPGSLKPSTCTVTGSWNGATPCLPAFWRCPTSGSRPPAKSTFWRPRVRRRPLQTCAI